MQASVFAVLGSVVVPHGLLLHGMWDLPGPGVKPVSLALQGGFFTTLAPGKPHIFFKLVLFTYSSVYFYSDTAAPHPIFFLCLDNSVPFESCYY